MASYEAGFIGAGNMGGALAVAAVKQVGGARVAVTCSTPEHTASTAARLDCRPETAEKILANSRFVFLGVKPQAVSGVLAGLTEAVASSEAVLVSMLAGSRWKDWQTFWVRTRKSSASCPTPPVPWRRD